MDFGFTPEQEKLREEIRAFLEAEIKTGTFAPMVDGWLYGWCPDLSHKMAARKWIGYAWPKEAGGQGKSYLDRLVLTEECLRYGARLAQHIFGDRQIGPCIIAFGNDEQKKELLPKILNSEISFCLGMSEPEAGSDLASLKTTAIETDKGFIVNGQKVWTSNAHLCSHIYLVARTDPNVPKHKGISEFIVDLKLPGVTINKIPEMAGHDWFCEVFFDNVQLPRSALIGQKNRGWHQITHQLGYERSGIERLMSNYPLYTKVKDYVKKDFTLRNDPWIRDKIAELEVEFEAGRWLIYRVAWQLSKGIVPNYEPALAKAYSTSFEQKLANTIMQILGLTGQIFEEDAIFNGWAPENYLSSPGNSLRGGTTEILRNIVALRGLGLPSS
jgi:acyl-CoA dehydrogenase